MSTPDVFFKSVKSTVDYFGYLIAQDAMADNPGLVLALATLDATAGVEEMLKSGEPAIVWSINSFLPKPADPLYELVFMVGAKTTADVSGELMASLMGAVQANLPNRRSFEIKNYSGPEPSEGPGETGSGFVTSVSIQEQLFDEVSGMRMAVVVAAVSRDL